MIVSTLVPESARAALRPLLRRRAFVLAAVLALVQLGLVALLTFPWPAEREHHRSARHDAVAPVIYLGDPSLPDAAASGLEGTPEPMPEMYYG